MWVRFDGRGVLKADSVGGEGVPGGSGHISVAVERAAVGEARPELPPAPDTDLVACVNTNRAFVPRSVRVHLLPFGPCPPFTHTHPPTNTPIPTLRLPVMCQQGKGRLIERLSHLRDLHILHDRPAQRGAARRARAGPAAEGGWLRCAAGTAVRRQRRLAQRGGGDDRGVWEQLVQQHPLARPQTLCLLAKPASPPPARQLRLHQPSQFHAMPSNAMQCRAMPANAMQYQQYHSLADLAVVALHQQQVVHDHLHSAHSVCSRSRASASCHLAGGRRLHPS